MIDLNAVEQLLVTGQTRIVYQWMKLEQFDQWWHWLLLLLVCAGVVAYALYWYRRDSVELLKPTRWALTILRLSAFIGILLYFLQLDKRVEQRVVRDSRLAVLVDTSLSMSLPGTPSSAGISSTESRIAEVSDLFQRSEFLSELVRDHQVSIYRFDSSQRPVAVANLPKQHTGDDKLDRPETTENTSGSSARTWMLIGCALLAISIVFYLTSLIGQFAGAKQWVAGSWALLIGSICFLVSLVIVAFCILPHTQYTIRSLVGLSPLVPNIAQSVEPVDGTAEPEISLPTDWASALAPSGIETRIGDSIKAILDREQGSPLAGIVLITDGRNNAGLEPKATILAAQSNRVPLYVIGIGSDRSPPNLQLVEVDVPRRLYPGDRFSLSTLIGSSGFNGQSVTVQILSAPKGASASALSIEAEKIVEIPADGTLGIGQFELEPKTVGAWQYAARVVPANNELDVKDNQMSVEVEVIERKNRVLIFAGGPTREYQFIRNLLFRDKQVESHVFLQTASPNSSQEAQKLLDVFPATRAELSEYDAILSIDADWNEVSENSVQALEQWVSEQAGGLLMIAGSVEMPQWLARSASGAKTQQLRSLSPVILDQRGSSRLASGRVESETPWPLTITNEGRQLDFLWLDDDRETSMDLWNRFEGVHTFYAAYELKPGAKALAYFSDPSSQISGQQPIYLASQFYGSGRVIFQGGGELWRLRSLGDEYFDRYYTKLVRWLSQGRLLLDSDRGILLVDREEAVMGEQVTVRAVLKNERFEPLVQSEAVARLLDPQGRNTPLVLRPFADGSQPGVYVGQFPIAAAGQYRLQLQIGGLTSDEILSAAVQARVPAMEMQNAERFDTLLSRLASETGGKYWVGAESVTEMNAEGRNVLAAQVVVQDQVAFLPGANDRNFQVRWLAWLMAWIAGSLSLEWFARRLHRLA